MENSIIITAQEAIDKMIEAGQDYTNYTVRQIEAGETEQTLYTSLKQQTVGKFNTWGDIYKTIVGPDKGRKSEEIWNQVCTETAKARRAALEARTVTA